MIKRETKLGFLFAVLANIFGGIQPVIANLRPETFDSFLFAGITAVIQIIVILPIFIIKIKILKTNQNKVKNLENPSHKSFRFYFGKSKWYLFIIIGTMFSLVMFLYYSGLYIAGSINGTLALKSTAFFGLLFGFLLLKEKVTYIQIIFSSILFFGLILAVTQGNFNLLELNIGVILILICAAIWMIGHTCSKPYLQNNITSSSELLIWRNIFSACILLSLYVLIFGPNQFISLLSDPTNAFFYIICGIIYAGNLFSWYQIIKYLDISLGTILITPQVIVSAIFGTIFGEKFTYYHLIGLIIIIISIIIINWESKRKKQKEKEKEKEKDFKE
ncbi:MAG: DMT family transporter [Promethearchaeota archaeon]|nr:MAG: DMT family transporter [Candidatus Lokiarchaeota archaeon]